jgi:ammonia channel protein AmtB
VWLQLVGALFIIAVSILMTSLIFAFIKFILRVPLRLSDAQLLIGDDAVHGEADYSIRSTWQVNPVVDVEMNNMGSRARAENQE